MKNHTRYSKETYENLEQYISGKGGHMYAKKAGSTVAVNERKVAAQNRNCGRREPQNAFTDISVKRVKFNDSITPSSTA